MSAAVAGASVRRRTPGLVDLQVNGFAGVDFNDTAVTADGLDHALAAMLTTGVTCCVPTLITAALDELAERLAALDHAVARSRLGPVMVAGYHLEGPFLNPQEGFAGCHPATAMSDPAGAAIDRLAAVATRPVLLVTLAPERPGALALVRDLAGRGIVVGLGHTAAERATIQAAAAAGATLSTHLGNGLPQQLHKFDNPLFAQLAEPRLSPSFIADGLHIPPWVLKVLIAAVGTDRAMLITDATAAALAPAGRYGFAGMVIERDAEGAVRLPGDAYLAGSSLTLDAAVRNVVAWEVASFDAAVGMASANPARLLARPLGAMPRLGSVSWDGDGEVREARLASGLTHAV